MRKKTLAVALAGALALSLAGTASADINDTTFELNRFSVKPAKSGTKKKPKPVKLSLGVLGGTKSGTGQPSTSTSLRITLPKGIAWNGKAWPRKRRCSKARAEAQRTDAACPRGSRIGSGHVDAQALSVNESIDVTAYVLTNGSLGLWLVGSPLQLNTMLEGKVRGRVINVNIPFEIQQPVPGVPSSIRNLHFSLTGKTRVKRKVHGALKSTSCPKNGKWTLKFVNVMTDGQLTDSRSVKCRK